MGRHDNQVVAITGAASGIGRATATLVVNQGGAVAGLDTDAAGLDSARREIGESFQPVLCDVASWEQVDSAFGQIETHYGAIHGLVNAAGVGGEPGDITRTTPAVWAQTIQVNLTGVFFTSRRAIRTLISADTPTSIVHVSSQLGIVGAKGSPAYGASKGGVIALGRAMALDHAEQGIRVNVVCPGPTETPLFAASTGPTNLDVLTEHKIPLGRIGRPEEIAAVIGFLVSRDSTFMTGAVVAVDGGWTAS